MYTLGCWKLEKFKKRYMPEVESLDIEKTEEERSSDADEEIDHNEIDVELEEQIKEDKEDEEDKNLKKLFANFNKKDRFNDSQFHIESDDIKTQRKEEDGPQSN